jgi:hypothetical protein
MWMLFFPNPLESIMLCCPYFACVTEMRLDQSSEIAIYIDRRGNMQSSCKGKIHQRENPDKPAVVSNACSLVLASRRRFARSKEGIL